MININLLPDEFRRSQRSSPRTVLLLLAASILAFGSLGTIGYLYFTVRASKQSDVDIDTERLANLRPQAEYSDRLTKEKQEFEKRNKTIREIASSRVLWTEKMDRFSEIINRDITTGRHQVWMSSLDIDSKPDSRTPGIKLKGYSAGSAIEKVSNFHEDLKNDSVFASSFVGMTAPKSKLENPEAGFDPPEKISFEFEMQLPVEDPKKK